MYNCKCFRVQANNDGKILSWNIFGVLFGLMVIRLIMSHRLEFIVYPPFFYFPACVFTEERNYNVLAPKKQPDATPFNVPRQSMNLELCCLISTSCFCRITFH